MIETKKAEAASETLICEAATYIAVKMHFFYLIPLSLQAASSRGILACLLLLLVIPASVVGVDWFGDVQPRRHWDYLRREQGMAFRFGGDSSESHFKMLHLSREGFVLLGGRNAVYNLSLPDLQENRQQRLEWAPKDVDRELCLVKGKSEADCQNYIRVFSYLDGGRRALVCGTNAFNPKCRSYYLTEGTTNMKLEKEFSGRGFVPFDPRHNSTAIVADDELYSGTVADFSGSDALIIRGNVRTEQYDLKHLNAPHFVGSVEHGDYVYFFFRETAVEYINCGKSVYSRVARICKHDQGEHHKFQDNWTTFLKARLNCSVPGDMPFYFNEIQSIQLLDADTVLALFTTPANAIAGSALCHFSLADIARNFAQSPFKSQSTVNANWLPISKMQTPDPRPGQCRGGAALHESSLNFIKHNTLMDEAVAPPSRTPFFVRASLGERLTAVAAQNAIGITEARSTANGGASSVGTNQTLPVNLVVTGTSDGRILTVSAKGSLFDSVRVFDEGVSVRAVSYVELEDRSVLTSKMGLALSENEVVVFPLSRCDVWIECGACVAANEGYNCYWDVALSVCTVNDYSNFLVKFVEGCPVEPEGEVVTETSTTTTSTSTTTSSALAFSAYEEMVPSPDSIEIPFDVMEINTRAAKFDPATREEGLLLDCPSCSCQCPQINQTSTLSSPTPPETSTATSTERNPPERDEQERISGGSDQDLIKKAHFLPDEGSTKEYEILLDLIDSGPENWDENSVSFVDKKLPKRSSSPEDVLAKTDGFSDKTLAAAVASCSLIALGIGFVAGILCRGIICGSKNRVSGGALDKSLATASSGEHQLKRSDDGENPDDDDTGGFSSLPYKRPATRAMSLPMVSSISGTNSQPSPPPSLVNKLEKPQHSRTLMVNHDPNNNRSNGLVKTASSPSKKTPSSSSQPHHIGLVRCLPQRVKRIYL